MDTRITARGCDVPRSVQDRTIQLLGKLDKFDPRISSVEVVFEEQKRLKRVDAVVKVNGDKPVVAQAESAEFRDALDTLTDRLVKILRRRRSQLVDRQGPSLAESVVPPEAEPEEVE